MAVNRGLVVAVVLAVSVWGVAFGGGLTVAVLTSNTTVTTTFETSDELSPINESAGDAPGVAIVPPGNETGETEELGNVTAPPAEPVTNGSIPTTSGSASNETVSGTPPNNETAPEPSPNNETAPEPSPNSETTSEPSPNNETATDADQPVTNGSSPTESNPALRADAFEATSTAVDRPVGLSPWPTPGV